MSKSTDSLKGLHDVTFQEVEKSRHKRIDPKGSWLTFVNRLGDSKPDRRKRKKKRKRKSNNILLGPPGPAGPPGPPGPAGRSVSKEEIIAGLEHLIKEEATRRAQQMLADMVSENLTPFNGSSTIVKQPGLTPPILVIPRIYAGFSLRLGSKTKVDRKSFREIKSFQQPFGGGGFQRGEAFNAKEGRFFPPMDGIYQFTVNLQLRIRTKRKLTDRLKTDENIRIIICIDSLCQTNTSIETITGVNIDNKMLTSSVTGLLLLKEKQYVSLYVDNSCSYTVLALAGSEFSGILLGT
ncbi:adipolin-like [Ruditapes philippinarum]|uniref:adipolin-like n=1 Tax=Ruditapes philippinarum TaxID=129788 RepID=UPI00295BC33D|nr:adipolin-like [Ruditapes philippinarum]